MTSGPVKTMGTPYLIAFLDFTMFDKESQRVEDTEIAATLDAHYHRVTEAIQSAGGRVIKFIGDATLLVFPEKSVDAGVRTILDLIASENAEMEKKGWECRLQAKAHFGGVVAGEFGANGDRRFDIFGKAVNATARLKPTGTFTLSAEAHGKLSPDLRRKFAKQAAPVTYSA
jgi:adenylate cyclase